MTFQQTGNAMEEHSIGFIVEALEQHFGIPSREGRGNPLSSLIMTILSQNTNDRNRDQAYRALRAQYPTWEAVMAASVGDIANAIRPAGLANQKSARIQEILRWIYQTYGALNLDFVCDQEPAAVIDTFLKLKGVGIKTISVVLMFACGVDIFPVDTHVHRICQRIGLVPKTATAEKTFALMQPVVPSGKSFSLHMNFLKLGRTICKARSPQCSSCPIRKYCRTGANTLT